MDVGGKPNSSSNDAASRISAFETPLWMGREMEKLIPDAGLVILEGGSHFAYLEQAARFNTIAVHFLHGS